MEVFGILLAVGLVGLVLVALYLGVAAFERVKLLERRLHDLHVQVLGLQAQVKRVADRASSNEAEPNGEPAPERDASSSAEGPAPTATSPTPSGSKGSTLPASSATTPPVISPVAPTPTRIEPPAHPIPAAIPGPTPTAPSAWISDATTDASSGGEQRTAPTHEASATVSHGIDIERWLGVRGAPVLGGIVIAIAGFLLLQYTIEHQMITPQARVILAAVFGVLAFVAAIPLRKRGYDIVAGSITGAGAVLLYSAAWAAHVLYGMIGFPAAFAAMVAVTALCGWLAQRHASRVIAVLGLAGGFATPLALSSSADRPLPLFGYLLLLDLGFLFVAGKRRWPSIGLLALLGTFVIQGAWIGAHMGPERLGLALGMLGVFAFAFVLFAARIEGAERRRWSASQAGAVLLPFVFAIGFAQDRDLGPSLWPTASLALVLSLAAGWIARRGDMPWLPSGSATGAVALIITWAVSRDFRLDLGQQEELFACALGLALVHLIFAELAVRRPVSEDVRSGARTAALVSALGFQLVAVAAWVGPHTSGPWPWVGLSMAMTLVTLRIVVLGAPPATAVLAAFAAGSTALLWSSGQVAGESIPFTLVWCAALVSFGGVVLAFAWLVHRRMPAWIFWAVAAFTVPGMFCTGAFDDAARSELGLSFGAVFVLGMQVAFAATASRSSALFVCAVVATWTACAAQGMALGGADSERFEIVSTLALAHAALFALWPIVRPAYWIGRTGAWRAAACAPLLWFPIVRARFVEHWPDAPVFLVPLAFEALAVFGALCLWFLRASEDRSRRTGRILFACVAILFAAMIVPLQVGREEVAITLALFAFGTALLARRVTSSALPWTAAIAVMVSTFLLVLVRPWSSFAHSDVRVWNVLAYTYVLPALAAMLTARNLRQASNVASGIAGMCAVLLVFAWINLEIADAFAGRAESTLRFEHVPARDLAASIAWAIYALVLLGLGVGRGRTALRWASLVLLMLTIGKVFLFDLGHLEGLYRAASVFGLGLSLLVVSVLYQRFVFRRVRVAT
jgi:uncharacterized membrane protein